ncbi:PepSY-associated TM helix domain-containing protein [Comamonas sp. JUb58]|uniref:PepSY-associated TM helix domain-containing protein n=1 Tax=Comamonas sp. JUb58 TaxID=2485114 RepID=UPI001061FAF6|nr:PepSY-associated TM helix domain-containing protein [Comamonas sp. JUb58]TDS82196.1 putative iron-regulated membrane protein [Comamonas sp. JUb58]
MEGEFRKRMAWLHTWCGLVSGWLLCAIFLTGTLSVFRAPITRWMQAQPAVAAAPAAGQPALQQAARYLAAEAASARFWRIELPQQAGDALLLAWQPAGAQRGGLQTAAMDPATGSLLPQPWGRKTEGGRHFMSFHYSLHAGNFGFWLVGGMAMCMLVALVSGVVVHRRIFADFFTLRLGKGQRSWLDAHNATGVLALPFLFMIAYTGLAYFYSSYMPWPLRAVYGDSPLAQARYQGELSSEAAAPRRSLQGQPAAMQDLALLLDQARQLTGRSPRMLFIERPGDVSMTVRIFNQAPEDSQTLLNQAGQVSFDGVTGAVLQLRNPAPQAPTHSGQIHPVLEALHVASFGGWTLRWMYFVFGLMGTAMMATGTVLFMVKRRKKSAMEFGVATAGVYRLVESLNVAALAGIALASIGYFWLNRLLPAAMPGRELWEIRGFLLIWAASGLHAACRPPARAWVEQLALAGALCLLLPLLNLASTGLSAWQYAQVGDWQSASVELVAMAFGLVLVGMAWKLQRAWQAQATPTKPTKAAKAPTVGLRYRLQVSSRVLAACLGGYAVAGLLAAALAVLLPRFSGLSAAEAVLAASLLGFVFYTVAALWVFSLRSARYAWLGLAGVALASALVLL